MNQHPEFRNLGNIGMEVARHDRYAVARRSILQQGDLFRVFGLGDSDRDAAAGPDSPGRHHANSGLLLAELERYFSTLPILSA